MRPWANRVLCVWMIVVVGGACEPQSGTDGSTSWLGACQQDTDCVSGLQCVCGACTATCGATAECSSLGANATCLARDAIGNACTLAPGESGVCSATCTADGDCPGGTRCINELCWLGGATGLPDAGGDADAATSTGGAAGSGGGTIDGGTDAAASSGGLSGTGGSSTGGASNTGGASSTGGSGNGGTATDGGMDGDAALACFPDRCEVGTVLCGGFCLDPTSNEQHCGATAGCGATGGSAGLLCAADSRCIAAACVADCVSPLRPPVLTPSGAPFPYAVQMADVNHDGRLDVISVNAYGNSAGVLLGNGDGTLKPAVQYTTGATPVSVAVGDVSGDGHPDLVTANVDGQSVSVLLGSGDGTFQPALTLDSQGAWSSSFITLGDVDGDCRQDLVLAALVTGNTYAHLVVAPGQADGNFGSLTDTGIEASMAALSDLNGDGVLDIAANGAAALQVALGNGDGTFGAANPYAAGDKPRWVSVGDLDGDGVPDLVAGNAGSLDVSVLRGNGNGTFQGATSHPIETNPSAIWPYAPNALGIGDLNGDGAPDITAVSNVGAYVATLLNDGSGALHPGPHYPLGGAWSVAVGDLNGDARADVAQPVAGTVNAIGVLLGGGTADFRDASTFPAATFAEGMAAADLDGKNGPDLALADYNGQRVGILLGNGDGTFQSMTDVATGVRHFHVTAGDLNGGGVLDLVTTHGPTQGVSVLLGNGDGTFQAQPDLLAGVTTHDAAIASLNGDASPDLVVTGGADGNASDVFILLGNGDGTFQPPTTIPLGGAGAQGICIADANGDAKQDVLVAVIRNAPGVSPGFLAVLPGNGDGTFQPEITLLAGPEPSQCRTADLNADGHPDVVVAEYVYGGLSVLLGTGASDGGALFQPPLAQPAGSQSSQFALTDVNADGKTDAVVTNSLTNDLAIHWGDGTGALSRAVSYAVGTYPTVVATGDFDGDGHADVATGNTTNGDVSVLLGKSVCAGP